MYLNGDSECSVPSFAWKSDFELDSLAVDWQRLRGVHVAATVEHRPTILKVTWVRPERALPKLTWKMALRKFSTIVSIISGLTRRGHLSGLISTS